MNSAANRQPQTDIHSSRVLILDFGAQYTQLIARRVRELGVYCEILPWDISNDDVRKWKPRGIILSGGPESVTDKEPPRAPQAVFDLGVPVLGICYGMQTMAQQLGAGCCRAIIASSVTPKSRRRCPTSVRRLFDARDAAGPRGARRVDEPRRPRRVATPASPPWRRARTRRSGRWSTSRASSTPCSSTPKSRTRCRASRLLERFVREISGCEPLWSVGNIIEDAIARVRAQVGKGKVLLGSFRWCRFLLVAALLHKAIGDQLVCVFVDHGLLRLTRATRS
jgi:GMP synthase (glutamine-hydrolysing)